MYILSFLIGLYSFVTALAAYTLIQAGGAIAGAGLGFNPLAMFAGIILLLVIMTLLGAVGSLLAAIMCFMRKKFSIALIGGLLSFVGLHFLFGLIGFIMMMGSKKEFT